MTEGLHTHVVRKRWVLLSIVLVVVSACSDLITGGTLRPTKARADDAGCPSCLTDAEKASITAALDQMSMSSDWRCQWAAAAGYSRLETGGFSKIEAYPSWAGGDGVYGASKPNSYGTIGLSDLAFKPGELANTIAHETAHADFGYPDNPSSPEDNRSANDVGSSCAGAI